ncbi:14029_t:CDS:2, partial [Cetraspora pellucida]
SDIVMLTDRFIVKNLEQHLAVSHTCVIVPKDPNHEFQADEILLNVSYCMFLILVNHEPKECEESTHITSEFTIIKLTDFDFISTNVNVVQNMQGGISSVASDNCSDIDLIIEDVESTTSLALKKLCVTMFRSSKQGIGLSTVINEFMTSFLTSVASVNTTSEMV